MVSSPEVAAAAAKLLQSCLTLCDPIDGSPWGSPVPGILQARTLEWVAIAFSNAWKWKVKVKSLSLVRLLATPWTVAHQAPPSMGFSRQEYWSGVPLPSPPEVAGDFKTRRGDKDKSWAESQSPEPQKRGRLRSCQRRNARNRQEVRNLGSGSQRHRGGRESKVGGIATAQNRHCHYLRFLQNVSRVKGLKTLLKLPVKKAQASERLLDKPPAFSSTWGTTWFSPEALGLVDWVSSWLTP